MMMRSFLLLLLAVEVSGVHEYCCAANEQCGKANETCIETNNPSDCGSSKLTGETGMASHRPTGGLRVDIDITTFAELNVVCPKVVCCSEENCGGWCREDIDTAFQCERPDLGGTRRVCNPQGKQSYSCCSANEIICDHNFFTFHNSQAEADAYCSDETRHRGRPGQSSNHGVPTVECCDTESCDGLCQTHVYPPLACERVGHREWHVCPAKSTTMTGDPHIQSWTEEWYMYMGEW